MGEIHLPSHLDMSRRDALANGRMGNDYSLPNQPSRVRSGDTPQPSAKPLSLPQDAWVNVLGHLDVLDLCQISCASRELRNACAHVSLWKPHARDAMPQPGVAKAAWCRRANSLPPPAQEALRAFVNAGSANDLGQMRHAWRVLHGRLSNSLYGSIDFCIETPYVGEVYLQAVRRMLDSQSEAFREAACVGKVEAMEKALGKFREADEALGGEGQISETWQNLRAEAYILAAEDHLVSLPDEPSLWELTQAIRRIKPLLRLAPDTLAATEVRLGIETQVHQVLKRLRPPDGCDAAMLSGAIRSARWLEDDWETSEVEPFVTEMKQRLQACASASAVV